MFTAESEPVAQMPSSPFTRRQFLKRLSAMPLALSVSPGALFRGSPVMPYVDGLTLEVIDAFDKLRPAGLSGVVADASVYVATKDDEGNTVWRRDFKQTMEMLLRYREEAAASDRVHIGKTGQDIRAAFESDTTAIIMQVQGGGEILNSDLSRLQALADLDLRIFQLTHHHNNTLAGGGLEASTSGFTVLGREAVAEMNRLGLIVDVSHSSDETALDACQESQKPVVLTHGAARAIVNNARCAPDEVIRAIAESGGVFGLFMMSFWLTTENPPTPAHYAAQVRHCVNVAGIDHVAVSNDFPVDGHAGITPTSGDNAQITREMYHGWWRTMHQRGVFGFDKLPEHVAIPEFNTIDRMAIIHRALSEAGFSATEVEKLMGGNWIRLFDEA